MKKVIALIVAIALLLPSAAVFAETPPTPNINTFAKMRVKCTDKSYTFTFSKPVDRLFIKWVDADEPQELLIDENLRASAFRWNHKYLAGIEEHFSNCSSLIIKQGKNILSEDIQIDPATGKQVIEETRDYKKIQTLKMSDDMEDIIEKFKEKYKKYNVEIDEPEQVFVEITDENGETIALPAVDENGDFIYTVGEMRAYSVKYKYWATNIATPDQAAFITLQDDEWVVYYNRSGNIVDVQHYENQF